MKVRAARRGRVFWVAVWVREAAEGERAKIVVRLGRHRMLFEERHQGTRGIPIRWHHVGELLAIRWEPRP